MDIKDLNKPQLILLALLLSFVASIATSITTVTLIQQAPPSITMPINRVIQQTVEKIQQVEGKFKAEFVSTNKGGFSFMKIGSPLDEKNKLTYTVPLFGDLDAMKTGQKIIVLGSTISSLIFDGNKDIRLSVNKS